MAEDLYSKLNGKITDQDAPTSGVRQDCLGSRLRWKKIKAENSRGALEYVMAYSTWGRRVWACFLESYLWRESHTTRGMILECGVIFLIPAVGRAVGLHCWPKAGPHHLVGRHGGGFPALPPESTIHERKNMSASPRRAQRQCNIICPIWHQDVWLE